MLKSQQFWDAYHTHFKKCHETPANIIGFCREQAEIEMLQEKNDVTEAIKILAYYISNNQEPRNFELANRASFYLRKLNEENFSRYVQSLEKACENYEQALSDERRKVVKEFKEAVDNMEEDKHLCNHGDGDTSCFRATLDNAVNILESLTTKNND